MNKRIRINGKLYEAVSDFQSQDDINTKNDNNDVKQLTKYAKRVYNKGKLNRNSIDSVYYVAVQLLDLLSDSSNSGETSKYINSKVDRAYDLLSTAKK